MQCYNYICQYRRQDSGVLKEVRCICPPYRLPPRCRKQHQKELLEQGKIHNNPKY